MSLHAGYEYRIVGMMSNRQKGNLLLLLTAFIWGSAFVAQSAGMDYIGPFTFNAARSFLGGLALIPVVMVISRRRKDRIFSDGNVPEEAVSDKGTKKTNARVLSDETVPGEAISDKAIFNENISGKSIPGENISGGNGQKAHGLSASASHRSTLIGGICCGIALGAASCLQQVGISMTTAGKAGFITALYIVIVPVLGVFIGKKIPKITWLCVAIAVAGFYLLCVNEGFSISRGDLTVLGCAVLFSIHILLIDHFVSQGVDGVLMSCIQFFVAGALSLVLTLLFEEPSLNAILSAKVSILYAGILSSGVGYTLQITAQKHTDPTIATLLMSLESVFAALSGWLILHETLSPKELLGCALVFAAVILAQIPLPQKKISV